MNTVKETKSSVKTTDIINALAENTSVEAVAKQLNINVSEVESVLNRWFVEVRNVQEKSQHN